MGLRGRSAPKKNTNNGSQVLILRCREETPAQTPHKPLFKSTAISKCPPRVGIHMVTCRGIENEQTKHPGSLKQAGRSSCISERLCMPLRAPLALRLPWPALFPTRGLTSSRARCIARKQRQRPVQRANTRGARGTRARCRMRSLSHG